MAQGVPDFSIPAGSLSWLASRWVLMALFVLTGLIAFGGWSGQRSGRTDGGSTHETLPDATSEPLRGQIEGLTPALLLRISGREIALSGIDHFSDETVARNPETLISAIKQVDARLRATAGAACYPAGNGQYVCQFPGESGKAVDVAAVLLINGIARTTANADPRYLAWQQEAIAHRQGLWRGIEAKE
jgi:hypothetical protein